MPLTAEERAAINRENALKSTGPRSAEGKERASRNALKHGLRAETFAISPEEAEELKTLTDEWVDYYQPESPGLRAALDRCVLSVVQQKRCARFQAARVGRQVREAEELYDEAQDDQVEALKRLLPHDPETAVRALKRLAPGCRWLIAEWESLQEVLDMNGCWPSATDRDLFLRLLGKRPDLFRSDTETYWFRLLNLLAREQPNPDELAWLLEPKQRPEAARGAATPQLPPRAFCVQDLREVLEENLAALRAREERLRAKIEEPNRAEAGDRALLLTGPEGALFIRYEKMHDAAFHKAYKTLVKGEEAAAPKEAKPAEPEPAPAPNEPEPEDAGAPIEADSSEIEPSPIVPRLETPAVPAVNTSATPELTRPTRAEAA